MLRLTLRELTGGPASTNGTLDASDPVFVGLGLHFAGPIQVHGVLKEAGESSYLWHGRVQGSVAGECRRCLTGVTVAVDDDVDVVFSADPELADDPDVYPLAPEADEVDLMPAVREELALRVSVFPLCRPDCKGLCATCGADLNAGPCACMVAGSTN